MAWLQAFSAGGVIYGPAEVRAQIDAALAAGASGYLLWNSGSFYSAEALQPAAAVPGNWPDGQFDLILISEVAYYLDRTDLARLVARARGAVLPEADIVLVHWLGVTHYPLSGDEAAEGFIEGARDFARVFKQSRTAEYRLDVLRATKA